MTNSNTNPTARQAHLLSLTVKEERFLRAIPVAGDFGPEGQGNWTHDVASYLDISGKSAGGIVSNLQKKGLLHQSLENYDGPNQRPWLILTELGEARLDYLAKREAQAVKNQAQEDEYKATCETWSDLVEQAFQTRGYNDAIYLLTEGSFLTMSGIRIGRFFSGPEIYLETEFRSDALDNNYRQRCATITVRPESIFSAFEGEEVVFKTEVNWSAWGNQDIATAEVYGRGLAKTAELAQELFTLATQAWATANEA